MSFNGRGPFRGGKPCRAAAAAGGGHRRRRGGVLLGLAVLFVVFCSGNGRAATAETAPRAPVSVKKETTKRTATAPAAEILLLHRPPALLLLRAGKPCALLRFAPAGEESDQAKAAVAAVLENRHKAERFFPPQKEKNGGRGARRTFLVRFLEAETGLLRPFSGRDNRRGNHARASRFVAVVSLWVEVRRVRDGARLTVIPKRRLLPPRPVVGDAGEKGGPSVASSPPPPPRSFTPPALVLELFPEAQGRRPEVSFDGGKKRVVGDKDAPVSPRRAVRLSFFGPDGERVAAAASAPAAWTVRKVGGRWRAERPLCLPPLTEPRILNEGRAAREMREMRENHAPNGTRLLSATSVFFFGPRQDTGRPELSTLRLAAERTTPGAVVEGSFRAYVCGGNPYRLKDVAATVEIAAPQVPSAAKTIEEAAREKREVRCVPCFFWEPPEGAEGVSGGEGRFRFRFTPPRRGIYGVRAMVRGPTGAAVGDAVALRVVAAAGKKKEEAAAAAAAAFVHVRRGERLFRDGADRVLIPFGPTVGGGKRPAPRGGEGEQKKACGQAASSRRTIAAAARRFGTTAGAAIERAANSGASAVRLVLPRELWTTERESAAEDPGNDPRPPLVPEWATVLDELFPRAARRGVLLFPVVPVGAEGTGAGADAAATEERWRRRLTALAARWGAFPVLGWELSSTEEPVAGGSSGNGSGAAGEKSDGAAGANAFSPAKRRLLRRLLRHLRGLLPAGRPVGLQCRLSWFATVEEFRLCRRTFAECSFLTLAPAAGPASVEEKAAAAVKEIEAEATRLHVPLLRTLGAEGGRKTAPPALPALVRLTERGGKSGLWLLPPRSTDVSSGGPVAPVAVFRARLRCGARAARALAALFRREEADGKTPYLLTPDSPTAETGREKSGEVRKSRAAPALKARERRWGEKNPEAGETELRGWVGRTGAVLFLRRKREAGAEAGSAGSAGSIGVGATSGLRLRLPRLRPGAYRALWLRPADGRALREGRLVVPAREREGGANGAGETKKTGGEKSGKRAADGKIPRFLPCPPFKRAVVLLIEPI